VTQNINFVSPNRPEEYSHLYGDSMKRFKCMDEISEELSILIQGFLKNPPLIIWGSGATIPFGLPSMWHLNEALKERVDGFDAENDNLEIELGKDKYTEQMPQIKQIIWEVVHDADISVLNRIVSNSDTEFEGIRLLYKKFLDAHPEVVNIVTTNYDRVLEHLLSYDDISFSDGFNGKSLSCFDETKFSTQKNVNIVKVHGSLNWFEVDTEIRYMPSYTDGYTPQIIAPGKNKYKEAFNRPYRDLIQKSDNLIDEASSFLIVGFGFNDEHLTPKIKANVNRGTPIILITKEITDSTFLELENAQKYVLLEESEESKTKITYKANQSSDPQSIEIDGNLWQLKEFMEIL